MEDFSDGANNGIFDDVDLSFANLGSLNTDKSATFVSRVAGAAMLKGDEETPEDVYAGIEKNTDEARMMIDAGEEHKLRAKIAIDNMNAKLVGFNKYLDSTQEFNPALVTSMKQFNAQQEQERLAKENEVIMYRRAVENIRTLAASGNKLDARLQYKILTGQTGVYGAMREAAERSLIIQEQLLKADADQKNESWMHWIGSSVANFVVDSLFAGKNFASRGMVPGLNQGIGSFFNSAGSLQEQGAALLGMELSEFKKNLPEFLENVRSKATTLGLEDPDRVNEFLRAMLLGESPKQQRERNFFGALDVLGLFGTSAAAARAVRLPSIMARMGNREAAAVETFKQFDDVLKKGADEVEKVGSKVDDVTDDMLPSSINPGKVDEGHVTVQKEVNDLIDTTKAAREAIEELGPAATKRLTTEEFANAVQAAKDEVSKRSGGVSPHDWDVKAIAVSGGGEISQVVAKWLFSDLKEATEFATSRGFSTEGLTPVDPADVDVSKLVKGLNKEVKETAEKAADAETRISLKPLQEAVAREKENVALIKDPKLKPIYEQKLKDAKKALAEAKKTAKANGKSVAGVEDDITASLPEGVTVQQDVSGAWRLEVAVPVQEEKFATSVLKPDKHGFVSILWNAGRQLDKFIFGQAVEAGWKRNAMLKQINSKLLSKFKSLNGEERAATKQIIMYGVNEKKWFTRNEFDVLFERQTGAFPSNKVWDTYTQYKLNNDIEYWLRNDGIYKAKSNKGMESAKFSALGEEIDLDGWVKYEWEPGHTQDRVFDVTTNTHHHTNNPLFPQRAAELRSQGYIQVRLEKPVKLRDGTTVETFIGHKSDFQVAPLRRVQLGYTPGGHRLYTSKYWVKQGSMGVQPDTGETFLKNPNVFVTAETLGEAKAWAEAMEEARLAFKRGADADELDEILAGREGLMSGEEFIEAVKRGDIDKDNPFEAVFDRELPSVYSKGKNDAIRFAPDEDINRTTFGGYYDTSGRMYYGKRGDHMPDVYGNLSPTLDPFEAQSRALSNVTQLVSFDDFKLSSIKRWVNTYSDNLNYSSLNKEDLNSDIRIFNTATIKEGTNAMLRRQIENQRQAIQRILRYETKTNKSWRANMRHAAEMIAGNEPGAASKWASNALFDLAEKNPLNALRSLAADMKLGMFNPGQFFIQTSTMFAAMALSPKLGLQGMHTAPLIYGALKVGRNPGMADKVLDVFAQRGVWKSAGFNSPEEFKGYAKSLLNSGFLQLDESHQMVNASAPKSTYAGFSGVDNIRSLSRMFFNDAEIFNRIVAHRISYGEAVEKFGINGLETAEAKAFLARRAETYSFNMSEQSGAAWQKGILSIPTQFWAYQARMIEAFTGKEFTMAQKLRLAAWNYGMMGTAGIPVFGGISDYINSKTGETPEIGTLQALMQRGFMDHLVHELTGADVQLGRRWGTGTWLGDLYKDMFGMSEYGPKSPAEMLGGATASILWDTTSAIPDMVKYWVAAESGGVEPNLMKDQWIKLFSNISTVGNAVKAYYAGQYGVYRSNQGTILADELPEESAVFIALGFPPNATFEANAMANYDKERKEVIDETSKLIFKYQQEGFTIRDKFEENSAKVSALYRMVPEEMIGDVLRATQRRRIEDQSFLDGLVRRSQRRELVNELEEELENGETNQ